MTLNIPNTFVAGTKAKAEEVNTNFSTVKTFCDGLETSISTNTTDIATKVSKAGDTMTGNLTIPAGTDSGHAINKSQIDALAVVPVGSVFWLAMNTAPTGYLKCNGAAVSRTTYANLFAAVGTTFGTGDGSTTFNLPDLRGEFIRGWDDSRGIDSGRTFGSSQTDDFKAHTHNQYSGAGSGAYSYPTQESEGDGNTASNPAPVSSTGGTETRPRNIALLAVIKY